MLVYISGPYTSKTLRGVQQNIELASNLAYKYWMKGYTVICPHKNTAFFGGDDNTELWQNGDLEILSKCDIIVMMKNWTDSKGAKIEYQYAKELGKKIIFDGLENDN